MTDIVSFGEWVQTRRNQLRYTRKAFADLVGCAPVTIKKIERDERRPSLEMAELLATHLQIPESEKEDFLRRARGEYVPRMVPPTEMSLAEAQAPAADEESPKENLPRPATPFFGRERELQQIADRLAGPNCRLLTLVKTHPSTYYESQEKARQLWEELVEELPAELIAKAEARGREMDLFETAESLLSKDTEL